MKEFLIYVGVIAGTYLAQTGFKIASVRKKSEFDWEELIDGLIDHVIRFASLILFFWVGSFISDKQIIPLGDKVLTIDDALTALAYSLMVYQAVQFFQNVKETYQIEDADIIKTLGDKEGGIG